MADPVTAPWFLPFKAAMDVEDKDGTKPNEKTGVEKFPTIHTAAKALDAAQNDPRKKGNYGG